MNALGEDGLDIQANDTDQSLRLCPSVRPGPVDTYAKGMLN